MIFYESLVIETLHVLENMIIVNGLTQYEQVSLHIFIFMIMLTLHAF